MQTLIKYISQFLLIPLIKELAQYLMKKFKDHQDLKKLEKENAKKGEEYAQADTVASARDSFRKLP